MKFKYRVWMDEIEKIEIKRETKCFIEDMDGRKEMKDGWRKYFDSWQEAHQYLKDTSNSQLQGAIREVEHLEAKLQAIKDMEEPCQ